MKMKKTSTNIKPQLGVVALYKNEQDYSIKYFLKSNFTTAEKKECIHSFDTYRPEQFYIKKLSKKNTTPFKVFQFFYNDRQELSLNTKKYKPKNLKSFLTDPHNMLGSYDADSINPLYRASGV